MAIGLLYFPGPLCPVLAGYEVIGPVDNRDPFDGWHVYLEGGPGGALR